MKIVIASEPWERWRWLVQRAPGEIQALGNVRIVDGDIYVDELHLPEQKVSGTSAEMSLEIYDNFLSSLAKKRESVADMLFDIHSHANMSVFWSSTDEHAIAKEFGGVAPYLVSMVVNKKGEFKARYDVFRPIHLTVDITELEIRNSLTKEQEEALEKEYLEKCKPSVLVLPFRGDHARRDTSMVHSTIPTNTESGTELLPLENQLKRINEEIDHVEWLMTMEVIDKGEGAHRKRKLMKRLTKLSKKLAATGKTISETLVHGMA